MSLYAQKVNRAHGLCCLLEQWEHPCLQCMMCGTVLFYYFGHFREKKKGINTKKKLILKTCICWLSLLYMKSKVEQMSYVSFAWCVKTDKYRQLQISPLSFNSVWNAVPNWLLAKFPDRNLMVVSLLILPCGGLDIVLCCDHILNAVVVSFSL